MEMHTNLETFECLNPGLPRWIEAPLALMALIVLAPVMAIVALAISLTSGSPVLFHQERVGKGTKLFTLIKFRTMKPDKVGLQVTASDDERVTPIGRILRRTKLDELPEFWNVVKGDMSLVGPRPEVPRYVDLHDERWRAILGARPGLTDTITLRLRNEESLMANVKDGREQFYVRNLQAWKLDGYLQYLNSRTWWTDVRVLASTAQALVRGGSAPPTIDELRLFNSH